MNAIKNLSRLSMDKTALPFNGVSCLDTIKAYILQQFKKSKMQIHAVLKNNYNRQLNIQDQNSFYTYN